RERILAQRASGQNHLERRAREFGRDIHGVGHNRKIAKVAQRARNLGSGGSGIQDHQLALLHSASRRFGDTQLLLPMELFLFAEGRIFQCPFMRWQSPSMRPVNQSVRVQRLQILANRNLRGFEPLGQVQYEYAALPVENFENRPATFFVQQTSSWVHKASACAYRLLSFDFLFISFPFVCPAHAAAPLRQRSGLFRGWSDVVTTAISRTRPAELRALSSPVLAG